MSTPQAYQRLKQRVANSGRFVDGWLDLGIEADGRLVGEIDARQPPRSMPQGVYELGISLFETADPDRVQASTWVENRAMRRVFEKLGFTEEGILRSYMPSERGRDDYVMYAITKAPRRGRGVRFGHVLVVG